MYSGGFESEVDVEWRLESKGNVKWRLESAVDVTRLIARDGEVE
jgi:hypothetical protein